MSNLVGRFVRGAKKNAHWPEKPRKTQKLQMLPDGGYRTLHPTRGWRYVSPRRAALYGLT